MSRFQFELATFQDDPALRQLVAETPMRGNVSVSFRREPSFFRAAATEGHSTQVIVARDRTTGEIAGVGCRSVRNRYVNGQIRPVGYLSSLRLREKYRKFEILSRGYAFLRQLHENDGQVTLYLTTIAESNHQAVRLLTSQRAGLPAYHDMGLFYTLVIPLGQRYHPRQFDSAIEVRSIRTDEMQLLLTFLKTYGPQRQFFPDYTAGDFFAAGATFKNLQPSDLLAAFRCGEIVGTLAGWNQRGFRQTVVESYSRRLRLIRRFYNGWSRLSRRPRLPAPGSIVRHVTAAVPVVRDNSAEVFVALLHSLVGRLDQKDHDFFLLGVHENDPLLPVAKRSAVNSYITRLYLVCWEDGESHLATLGDRPPYLELGCL